MFAAVAAVVVLVGAIGAVALVMITSRTDYPAQWDSRVAAIAKFDEKTRGLKYKHPVPVAFLTDKQFRKEVTHDEKSLTKDDKKQLQQAVEFLRALGLVSGKVDLFKATNKLQGETVLAFYDPDKKRVRVRGTKLDVATRVTVAHELTHVLQDQYFDLNKTEDKMTSDEVSIFRSLVEGDAVDVENAYIDRLSSAEKKAYDNAQSQQVDTTKIADVPEVLQVLQGAPYEFGPPLVSVLRADGGVKGLDRAFAHPPKSEEQLVNPLRLIHRDNPKKVARPKLRAGEHKVDSGTFGAIGWYVTLSARVDPKEALRAVDGWGGDQYVSYKRGTTTCVRAAFVGDTPRDTDEMHAALSKWVAGMPAGAASVRAAKNTVTLESCDPGADVKIDTGAVTKAISVPIARVQIIGEFVKQGAPLDTAMCVANKLVASLTPEQLGDNSGDSIDQTVLRNQIQTYIRECRA
jgi:hypothetical protein